MAPQQYFRMGTIEDFKKTNKTILDFKAVKNEVKEALNQLAIDSENIVIEQIKGEYNATIGKMVGRGAIIVSGICSFWFPIAACGVAIGYVIVGGSMIYEMKVKKDKVDKMKKIRDDLNTQLEKYNEAYQKVLKEIGCYDAFMFTGNESQMRENLKRINDIIDQAETQFNADFVEIKEFLLKVRKVYSKLTDKEKSTLNSKDFLMDAKELFEKARKYKCKFFCYLDMYVHM